MFPKDALDLFHLSESAVKRKLEDAKENKRQRRIWEKGYISFLVINNFDVNWVRGWI